MLGKVLSFVFDFAEKELGEDLKGEFTDDDTWTMLVTEFHEFAAEHGSRIADQTLESCDDYDDCLICGQLTFNLNTEHCELCNASFAS